MVNHIKYLEAAGTVCQRPELLGKTFVTVDTVSVVDSSCKLCLELLVAYSEKKDVHLLDQPPNEFFRGVMWATAVSSVFWFVILIIVVLLIKGI